LVTEFSLIFTNFLLCYFGNSYLFSFATNSCTTKFQNKLKLYKKEISRAEARRTQRKERTVLATKNSKLHKEERIIKEKSFGYRIFTNRPFVALIAVVNSSLSPVGRVFADYFIAVFLFCSKIQILQYGCHFFNLKSIDGYCNNPPLPYRTTARQGRMFSRRGTENAEKSYSNCLG